MGYSTGDLNPFVNYTNRRDSRIRERNSWNAKINQLEKDLKRLNVELPQKQGFYDTNKPLLLQEIDTKEKEIVELKQKIKKANQDIVNLEFDIKANKVQRDKNYNNTLKQDESRYDKKNTKTDNNLKNILPFKKKENVETSNFYNLLESQNDEVSSEIVNQKNNLTTSDRRYIVNDSKIPYYSSLNGFLLFLYILIAIYVSYRIAKGMITENIYGKFIIILIISLYPIYMFNLEMTIYNQYKLIKSMIRAEPYKPVE